MSYQHLLVDRPTEGVAVATLNRPDKLNALSVALLQELDDALATLEGDPAVRCVVLTGAGERAFSAGADIHEQAATPPDLFPEQMAFRSRFAWRLANFPKPTIGAINGLTYGGAALLATGLDLRIGCERSTFRFLAASYGRMSATWTLPYIVGWAHTKELLYTGRLVTAEQALDIGLLNALVPAGDVVEAAVRMGEEIAGNTPEMVQGMKQLLLADIGRSWPEMYDSERTALTTTHQPTPFREGFSDFLARKPMDDDVHDTEA
jgi:enoyl-CoA hydratase/carnithine racemase